MVIQLLQGKSLAMYKLYILLEGKLIKTVFILTVRMVTSPFQSNL